MSDPIQPVPSLREPPTDAPTDPLAPVPDAPTATGQSNSSAPAAKEGDNAAPIDWRVLVDRVLAFLSSASNETLGACLFGLGAGTYLILGRVGLILIGVVAGVALHASWESHAHGDIGGDKSREARRKKELGLDVAHRVLSWRDKRVQDTGKDEDDVDLSVKLYSGQELDFADFRPETAAALTELTDAVIRDYVKYAREIQLYMYTSNETQVVVQPYHSHRKCLSQLVPPDVGCLSSVHVYTPFPKATSRHVCRLRDQIILFHDHLLLRALQCHLGESR